MSTQLKLRKRIPVDKRTRKLIDNVAADFREAFIKSESELYEQTDWVAACQRISKKYKLRRFAHGGVSRHAFRSRKFGFIIKEPYLCGDTNDKPYGAIYTKIVKLQNHDPIFIQPLVNLKYRRVAHEALWDSPCRGSGDLHSGNVGEYKGYAVVFDW